MASRVTIYDHFGNYLTEVNATFRREYKLNEFGSGSFTLLTQDQKCREDYLQFGNFALVEHEKLPAWGGMIDTPRIWGHGSVTSTAYSAEYILTTMISDRTANMAGVWGSIYQQLVEQMFNNDIGGMVRIGAIYGGGKSVKRTYNYANLYDEVSKLCKDSGNDFEFLPAIDADGRLFFTAHWHEKRGGLKQFTLYEDKNIRLSTSPLREQGRIANRLRIYGPGATFETRGIAKENDIISSGKYGERWLAQLGQGDDVAANAEQLIIEYANPRKTFDLTAIDIDDTFFQCRVGDQFPVSFHSVGFSGSGFGTTAIVRILQMSYDEQNNVLQLVADEVKA